MNRFHVHVAVDDLQKNVRFYSAMFGAAPTVEKPDDACRVRVPPQEERLLWVKPNADHPSHR